MTFRKPSVLVIIITAIALVVGYVVGTITSARTPAFAQGGGDAFTRATKALPERDAYFPNSEDLGPNEMRIIACGTGMPSARESQAASCFLVELGNGDKFLFDIGTGSAERISAMQIPYNYLNKVFIGHLHSDHFGDLDALYCGGIVANRVVPLALRCGLRF